MNETGYNRIIRRIRNSGLLFHKSDNVADRAYKLLGRLLKAKGQNYPYHPPVDRTGHTAADRSMLASHGLCPTDFM